MLSERQNGFKIAMNALNVGRIKLAAACLDSQRRITTEAIVYANARRQFKTPIAEFGAIKHKLAEMATNTYVGESAIQTAKDIEDRITLRIEKGNTHQEAELKGVEEYAIECSLLKVAVLKMFKIVPTKEFRFLGVWDSQKIPHGSGLARCTDFENL